MNWILAFAVCFVVLHRLPVSGADKPGRSSLMLGESISPNNAYAITWTYPNLKDFDWDALPEDLKTLNDPLWDQVTNRLVELKTGRRIEDLNSSYWELPKGPPSRDRVYRRPRRVYLEVAWSKDSDLAVVLHSERYSYLTLEAVKLSKGKVVGDLEFGHELESLLRSHLAATYPAEYKRDGERLSINYGNLQVMDNGKVTLETIAAIPKGHDGTLENYSQVTLTLPVVKGKMRLVVSGFGTTDDNKPFDRAVEDAKQLAEAEKKLDREYQSLNLLLDADAREALNQEQVRSSGEFEKITNLQSKANWIGNEAEWLKRRRIEILEKRWESAGKE